MRRICFFPNFASNDHLMMTYEIATVNELHTFEMGKFILSSMACRRPSSRLGSVFSFASESLYEFRTNTGLRTVLLLTKSKYGRLSLPYRVPLMSNKLLSWDVLPSPVDLSNCSDVSINDSNLRLLCKGL